MQSDEVGDHWLELEPSLLGAKEQICEIAKSGSAKLTLVNANSERMPSLQIPPSMAAFAGLVNAVIDIDHLQ
ncbi:MAG: hypothetical protein EOO28_10800 [Comamonadaceae bacterium]|nr:MAG: hypothetical protein EOO28_10800 [Comamonadaceae bacterium]